VHARGDQAGRVADVVQPGGGFQQIGVRAEHWRQAAGPGGDALDVCPAAGKGVLEELCVPITSSTSCDQPIFVDHAADLSLSSDAVQVEIDWLR
jgi:hypothetical protein